MKNQKQHLFHPSSYKYSKTGVSSVLKCNAKHEKTESIRPDIATYTYETNIEESEVGRS
jgi:hypothetical protein